MTDLSRAVVSTLLLWPALASQSAEDGFLDAGGIRIRYQVSGPLIGAGDRFIPDVQRLSRAVPDTKVIVIPGANHATTMTHPKFGEELVAWLCKQP